MKQLPLLLTVIASHALLSFFFLAHILREDPFVCSSRTMPLLESPGGTPRWRSFVVEGEPIEIITEPVPDPLGNDLKQYVWVESMQSNAKGWALRQSLHACKSL
jgi:hypothetical protein